MDTNIIFLLASHKVDFIAGQTNPLFDPLVEKKSCATREKHSWLLNSKNKFFSLVAQ